MTDSNDTPSFGQESPLTPDELALHVWRQWQQGQEPDARRLWDVSEQLTGVSYRFPVATPSRGDEQGR